MSDVERWRMPSGAVASISLSDRPVAVQGARELLAMNGATLIVDRDPVQAFAGDEYDAARAQRAEQKNALTEAATAGEGENQNTNAQKENQIMTMMADATDTAQHSDIVREWAKEYNVRRDAAAAEIQADPAFIAWADEQIAGGPWTMRDCVHRALENYREDMPDFPTETLPAWAVSCEVGYEAGGEVTIHVSGQVHERGEAYAQAMTILTVTVGGDDDPIGTVRGADVLIESNELAGLDPSDEDSWRVVADTAFALNEVASEITSALA